MAGPLTITNFPGGSAGKESACNAGDLGSIPGLGRYPGEGISYPWLGESPWREKPGELQSSGLQRVKNDGAISFTGGGC